MADDVVKSYAALEEELVARGKSEELVRRQVELLQAIVRTFRETLHSETEEDVARICLKVAEDLTGSAYGFVGELNIEGRFDTTTLSDAGWAACRVPRERAVELLRNMPSRGINRIGLKEQRSWFINDPAAHPESVRKPDGHPPLTSFIGVPLRYMGGITGMIALAGKPSGYTDADLQEMELLAVAFVEVLNRRRAEKTIKVLNDELQRRILQVEAANRELETFSYSVSHDLRAPLRHITGFVELLHKRDLSSLDEKSLHYLEVISDGARKMGALIDDLLAFSRMGRAEIHRGPVDMNRMVTEVIAELADEAAGREIEWRIRPLPVVEVDAALLRQVVVNLIANALKFTRSREVARIEIGATDEPLETLFFVRDNGVGFDMRYVEKLFGLFQRLHSSDQFEGTGVGLANVQHIVRRHGGRVWAEGAVDGGATFWFTLPKPAEGD